MSLQVINREDLLHQLESVSAGLSTREIIEQSSCFVFHNGKVLTFNGAVACSMDCIAKLTGAVQSGPLLGILRKLLETDITMEEVEGELRIEGKSRKCGIRREQDVLLPVDKIENPGEWIALPDAFLEAIDMVQHCASKDASQFNITCIHIHPKYIEAFDGFQVTRVKIATGVREEMLVTNDSIRHITSLGVKEFSESETWIHFRSESGLVLSCRRHIQDYPDLREVLACSGKPISIPRGLGDAADKAAVFSSDSADENQVKVELRPGMLRIRGEGSAGWFQEIKKLKYDGPALAFLISPALLVEITKKHTEAEITAGKLKVDGGSWCYVTCLGSTEDKKSKETAPEPTEEESESEG